MKVAKENLVKNLIEYEASKLKDSFAGTPNLPRTLKLGRMMMGKHLTGNSKPVKRKRNAANLWMRYLSMEAVSRRIYQGVPDYISLRTDYFCSLFMCGDLGIFEAIGLLGYLVRYGMWNTELYLVIDRDSRATLLSETGLLRKEFDHHIRLLVEHQLFIKVVEMDGVFMYKLNPDLVMLLNEKDNYFVKENHKPLKQKAA